MALKKEDESYLELFDVARKEKVAKAPSGGYQIRPANGRAHFHPASWRARLGFLYRRRGRVLPWL